MCVQLLLVFQRPKSLLEQCVHMQLMHLQVVALELDLNKMHYYVTGVVNHTQHLLD